MTHQRSEVEGALESLQAVWLANESMAFVDCFTEDCTFANSVLEEPIQGRDALREYAATWPLLARAVEWCVIDGDRAVVRWEEGLDGIGPEARSWRGTFTLVYDGEGKFSSYECFFDTAEVTAALEAAAAGD